MDGAKQAMQGVLHTLDPNNYDIPVIGGIRRNADAQQAQVLQNSKSLLTPEQAKSPFNVGVERLARLMASPVGLGMIAGSVDAPPQLVPNPVMKRAFELSRKFQGIGNISIPETDEVLQMASQHLKLPEKVSRRMSIPDLLDTLTSMADRNQSYAYKTLPEKVAK